MVVAYGRVNFWHDLDLREAVLDDFAFESAEKAKLVPANLVIFVPHVSDRYLDCAALDHVHLTWVEPRIGVHFEDVPLSVYRVGSTAYAQHVVELAQIDLSVSVRC